MAETGLKIAEEIDLERGSRSKIGMAAFRCRRAIPGAIPKKKRLSQARAGSDCRHIGFWLRRAGVKCYECGGINSEKPISGSFKIINPHEPLKIQGPGYFVGIDQPG